MKVSADKPAADQVLHSVMITMREANALGVLYGAAVARMLAISTSDLECLDFIATQQPITAGVLADATGLTTGAITGVVDRLEKAGFVRRVRHGSDRRKVFLNTTPRFQEEVITLYEPMQRLQAAAVGRFSDADLRIVAAFMTDSLTAARDALAELSKWDEA